MRKSNKDIETNDKNNQSRARVFHDLGWSRDSRSHNIAVDIEMV